MQPTATQPIRRPRPHRRAFSLVEILIVISIAAVIMSAVAGGAFAVIRAAKINRTTATLKVLQATLDVYKKDTEVYPVITLNSINASSPFFPAPAQGNGTAGFLGMVYYGDTTTAFASMSADKVAGKDASGSIRDLLQGLGSGSSVFDRSKAIIKDDWGNPVFVSTAGTAITHAVFASAGPDGNPNTTADNIYSEGGSQ